MAKFGKYDVNAEGELISDSGREYSLMEGVSYPKRGYTSDIVFVMDYSTKPSGVLVGFLYGATDPDDIADDICRLIDNYERTGARLV